MPPKLHSWLSLLRGLTVDVVSVARPNISLFIVDLTIIMLQHGIIRLLLLLEPIPSSGGGNYTMEHYSWLEKDHLAGNLSSFLSNSRLRSLKLCSYYICVTAIPVHGILRHERGINQRITHCSPGSEERSIICLQASAMLNDIPKTCLGEYAQRVRLCSNLV